MFDIKDKQFLSKMEDIIQTLMYEHSKIKIPKSDIYKLRSKYSSIDTLLTELETVISDRFGILFRILPDIGYTVIPYSGSISDDKLITTINRSRSILEYMNEIIDYIKEYNLKDADLTKIKNINDLDRYPELSTMFKMYIEFDDLIKKGGIKYNDKEFKVKGLKEKQENKKAPTILTYSVFEMSSIKVSVKEHVASFLHEIGHQINTIKYAMYTDVSDYILVKNIFDKRPKTADEYKTIILKEIGTTDDITLDDLIQITKKVNGGFEDQISIYTNKVLVESVADELPTAMGYSVYLAKNLETLGGKSVRGPKSSFHTFMGMVLLYIYYSNVIILTISAIILLPYLLVTGQFIGILTFLIDYVIALMYYKFFELAGIMFLHTNTGSLNKNEHEDIYERVRRMKLQLIRELRSNKVLTQKEKSMLLGQISKLDNILKPYEGEKTVASVLVKALSLDNKSYAYKELLSRLNTLANNDLYTTSNRLKDLL